MTDAQRNALNDHLTATYAVGEDGQVAPIAGGDPIGNYQVFGGWLDIATLPDGILDAIADDDDELTEADVRTAAQIWADANAPAMAQVVTAQGRTNQIFGWIGGIVAAFLLVGLVWVAFIAVDGVSKPDYSDDIETLRFEVSSANILASEARRDANTAVEQSTRVANAAIAASEAAKLAAGAANESAAASRQSAKAAERSASSASKAITTAKDLKETAEKAEAEALQAAEAAQAARASAELAVKAEASIESRVAALEARTNALEQNVLDLASGLDYEVEHSKHKGLSGREEKKLVAEVAALYADLVAAYGDTTAVGADTTSTP